METGPLSSPTYRHLEIQFGKKDPIKLIYSILETDIAQRWAHRVAVEWEQGLRVHENGWFHGFEAVSHSLDSLAAELNRNIAIINHHFPNAIPEQAKPTMSQEEMNILHHHFENYRGGVLSPGPLWQKGNNEVKAALEEYNVLIHRHEALTRNLQSPKPRASIMFRHPDDFHKRRQRFPLEEHDFEHFHLQRHFGQVYLHYCEVGKPILDVFFDKDSVIGDENVRPLAFYSSDFDCYFANPWSDQTEETIRTQLKSWLESQGLNIQDASLALGYLSLAELDWGQSNLNGLTQADIIAQINDRLYVTEVKVYS